MSTVKRMRVPLLCAAILLCCAGCRFAEEIDRLTVADIRPAAVKDGEYTGTQNVFPVTASVRVTVKDGAITGIQMLSHGHGPGHGAEAILDRVVAAQSLSVDAVSGSTYSSKVVLKAIELALEQGL